MKKKLVPVVVKTLAFFVVCSEKHTGINMILLTKGDK